MLAPVNRLTTTVGRNFMKNVIRNSGDHGPMRAGENLPFQITNRYRLTFVMTVFIGSAMAVPFAIVRYQLLKQNQKD